MPTPAELEQKLFNALDDHATVFLGLSNAEHGHARPMTFIADGDRGPFYVFTTKDNDMVVRAHTGSAAFAHYVSKGHDLWACVHGHVTVSADPAVINRLWNSHIAAWFDGKDDPKIALLRFDPEHAEIWEDSSSVVAGVKTALGLSDPKADAQDSKASVQL
ncbi:pyridoxamine 5'-phosphate oxidase family protein [Falsirhodobacter sp. alg1]|uniref:pyridoxamine 5'-phosphate oxidase family protein n=1 Tax=Falsirhodobacter sp. alg1 TaxID=1472418 RepID=UPI0005EF7D67|nr:pyridoxamine 5'-phosphate oxidase family protein [Falsirhodobacter sp. alg1]